MPPRVHDGVAPWPPVMVVWGPGFKSAPHRHHCVQLLMTLRGSLLIRSRSETEWRKCGGVWIRPDANHEMDARGRTLLIAFVSAESEMGAALSERIERDITRVPAREVARWRAALGTTPNERRTEGWLGELVPRPARSVAIHPRRRNRPIRNPRRSARAERCLV